MTTPTRPTEPTMTADDVAYFEIAAGDDEVARRVLATYDALQRLRQRLVDEREFPEYPPTLAVQLGYNRTATFTPRRTK